MSLMLIRSGDLKPEDLPYVENPFFAVARLRDVLYLGQDYSTLFQSSSQLEPLLEDFGDNIEEQLLAGVENGEYFLVDYGNPPIESMISKRSGSESGEKGVKIVSDNVNAIVIGHLATGVSLTESRGGSGGGRMRSARTSEPSEPTEVLQDTPAASTASDQQAVESTQKWISLKLVDDELDKPISKVEIKIKLPDGKIVSYKTDANGCIKIEKLTDGECEIVEINDEDGYQIVAAA